MKEDKDLTTNNTNGWSGHISDFRVFRAFRDESPLRSAQKIFRPNDRPAQAPCRGRSSWYFCGL